MIDLCIICSSQVSLSPWSAVQLIVYIGQLPKGGYNSWLLKQWVDTCMGVQEGVPSSWPPPGPDLAVTSVELASNGRSILILSISLSLPLSFLPSSPCLPYSLHVLSVLLIRVSPCHFAFQINCFFKDYRWSEVINIEAFPDLKDGLLRSSCFLWSHSLNPHTWPHLHQPRPAALSSPAVLHKGDLPNTCGVGAEVATCSWCHLQLCIQHANHQEVTWWSSWWKLSGALYRGLFILMITKLMKESVVLVWIAALKKTCTGGWHCGIAS